MSSPGRPKVDEPKSWSVLIAVEEKYRAPVLAAAAAEDRSMSDYWRTVVKRDLQNRGLLDQFFEPIPEATQNG